MKKNGEPIQSLWLADNLESTKYIFAIRARTLYQTKQGKTRFKYQYLHEDKEVPWDSLSLFIFGKLDKEDSSK